MNYYVGDFSYFLIFIPVMIFSLWAQGNVSGTFNKYSKYANKRGYTGADIARQLLMIAGINDVVIEPVRGNLTDHYDPKNKVLRLSENVYNSTSIAAIGVAAHETGHAMQHKEEYFPLSFRNFIYPMVNIGSKLAMPLVAIGCFLFFIRISTILLEVGVLLFAAVVVFNIITLPVEFNASRRAIKILGEQGFLDQDEIVPAKKVLRAAALTYVAATAMAILQLLRIISILNGRRRND